MDYPTNLSGLNQFGDFCNGLQEELDTLPIARHLADAVIQEVHAAVNDRYATQTDARGNQWPPHAPSTVRIYGRHPLLILSGDMFAASTSRGAPGGYEQITDRSIVLGVMQIYAPTQQFGDPNRNIPARPFFELDDQAIERIREIVTDYITTAWV